MIEYVRMNFELRLLAPNAISEKTQSVKLETIWSDVRRSSIRSVFVKLDDIDITNIGIDGLDKLIPIGIGEQ